MSKKEKKKSTTIKTISKVEGAIVDSKVTKKFAKKLEPMDGKVFIWRIYREAKTDGGIIVSSREKEQTPFAIVLVSSAMFRHFKVGDTVMVLNHCGTDTTVKGHRISIVDEEDILALYHPDEDEDIFNEEHNNAASTKRNVQKQKGTHGKEFKS